MTHADMSAGMLGGRYDWRLVALSITIAIGASYAALDLAGRVSTSRGRARALWLIGGAASMGLGIWAMHYIGMLAFRLPIPIAYHVPLVVVSLLAAFAASAVALYVVSRKQLSPAYLIGGSLAMGSGIVAMHYIGMAAMSLAAHRTYSAAIVALSVAIAVVVSGVALHLAFHLRDSQKNSAWSRPFAALVMGIAIASMHYTGMAAVCFHPADGPVAGPNLVSVSALGVFCIATITFTVLGSSLLLGLLAGRRASQRQRETMERWGLLLDASQDGLFDVNMVTGSVFLSPRWMTMLGYGPDELPQEWSTWEKLLHPEERDVVVKKVADYLAGSQGALEAWFRLRHRDGSWVWILSRMQAAWDETGKPLRLTGSHTDISERRRHEEQLLASERKYRELFDNGPLPSLIYRLDGDMRLLDVNRAAVLHYGWTREEFLRMTIADVRMPGEFAEVEAELKQCAAQKRKSKRIRHRRNGKSAIWVEMSSLELDIDGHRARLVKVNDVTAQIEAENAVRQAYEKLESLVAERTAELQKSYAKWQGLVEALPQFIWLSNPQGEVTYVSRQCEEYTGFSAEELLGTGYVKITHPDDLARIQSARAAAYGNSVPYDIEIRVRSKTGGYRWFLHSSRPVYGIPGGPPMEWLGSTTDIDDQKRSKELLEEAVAQRTVALEEARARAEQAAQAKGDFLATMSHEIRTPMNGVLGMAHLMMDTPLDDTQKSYLHTIQSSGQALLTIINDILDFSKIEAGKIDLYEEEFDLRTVVEECMELVRPQAAQKHLDFALDVRPELPARVIGDCGRIRQILLNLISNAVKFTAAGSVSVSVTVEADQPNLLRFSVRDTGIGLSAEQVNKLFQAFTQADNSTTRRFGGTGLGLSIAKRLVELMGGRIDVDSRLGEGSTFWFNLPLKLGKDQGSDSRAAKGGALKDMFAGSRARILVADDVAANQMVVSGLLRQLGLRSDAVSNGAEAIAAIHSLPYDLVLMDVHMPEMDGLEAARRIRACESSAAAQDPASGGNHHGRLPVIALTASAMPGDRQKFMEAGMDDYISKPIMPAALVEILRKWLPSVPGESVDSTSEQASPGPSAPAACTLNMAGLLERLMGDELLARAVMDGFASDMPSHVQSLARLVDSGSAEEVAELAHRIRGAAATVGGEAVQAVANEIEIAGKAGDLARARAQMPGLQQQFTLLMEAIAAAHT
jgi:PAS domain S-box-containing protein